MNFWDILRSVTGADNYFDRVPANQLAAAGQPAHPATSTPQGAYGNGYGDSVPSPGFGASMHTLGQALSPVQPAQAATLPAGTTPGPQPATPSANDLTAALVRSVGAPTANPPTDPWAGLRTAAPNSGVTGEPGSVTLVPNGQNPFGSLSPQIASAQDVSPMTTGSVTPKSPSLLDRFENFTASPRGQALGDMFAGWAMGKSPQQSLGYGAFLMNKGTKSRRKNNDTVDWLVGRGMDKGEAEALVRNPTALSAVLKQMMTPEKPTSDIQNYHFYANQALKNGQKPLSFNDWNLQSKKAGATNVTVGSGNSFAKEFGKQNADNFFDRRGAAMDAAQTLRSDHSAMRMLDKGVITGFGANFKLGFGKALQAAGIHLADDAVANTEAYVAARAKEVGRIIKLFGAGTGLSDSDREFATKAAAGDIKLNAESMRRILEINDKAATNIIKLYNADASKIDPKLSPYPLAVEMPTFEQDQSSNADPLGIR